MFVIDAYIGYIPEFLVTKETKPTSVNVLYTTSMRPLYTVTTSGGRTNYVTPHQITTSGSHQTVNTPQQRTRLLSQRTTIYSVSKKSKSPSVNVLYTTSMRPFYTVTTSGGRTQYVPPHQTRTSRSQQTTVNISLQTTKLLSQRTTIYSVSITNQTKNNVGDNVNVTGGMYCTTRTTSSTERDPFLPNDYDLMLNRVSQYHYF